ncbi:MAG: tetratricopeptide repeat protein, partial [Candidatus Zixiibacteriota bacterium]
ARELADRNAFGQATALLENSSGTDIDSVRTEISEKKETWRRTKLAEARGAESAGDHAGALEALSALKTEYPADESIDLHIDSIISRAGHLDLLALASRKLADGEAEKARELSEAVLALDSANASALALRDSALALNDSSDGLDELARDTEAWRAFSEALRLVRAGEVESADRILAELLKRYPDNKELLKNRRQIELRLKGAK